MYRFSILMLAITLYAAPAQAALQCTAPTYQITTSPAGVIQAQAQALSSTEDNLLLEGDATLETNGQRLSAQRIEYNRLDESMQSSGTVTYLTSQLQLTGERLAIQLAQQGWQGEQIAFSLSRTGGTLHGTGRQVQGNPDKIEMQQASYSICPPDAQDWSLSADRVSLDLRTGQGTLRAGTLYAYGWPIFYLPWLQFPISDQRQSGLLTPSIDSSDSRGLELSVPWYWNIAPQSDMTITARSMQRRGLQWQTENRYLHAGGLWTLHAEYLDRDRRTQRHRSYASLQHHGELWPAWRTHIDLNTISDAQYEKDFNDTLYSRSYWTRELALQHSGQHENHRYQLGISLEDHQASDPANRSPYSRVPQVALDWQYTTPLPFVALHLNSQWDKFERDERALDTANSLDIRQALRHHFTGGLSLQLNKPAWQLQLDAQHLYTNYQLTTSGANTTPDRTRNLTSLSARASMHLIRDRGTMRQTLEPELYYLKVPYRDQSDLPIFDSADYDFGLADITRDNRFSGIDRIGDSEHVGLGLTTRRLTQQGDELMRAQLGQIVYLADRRVQIDSPTATQTSSNVVGQISLQPHKNWQVYSEGQWDPHSTNLVRSNSRIRYALNDIQYLQLTHHQQQNRASQVQLTVGLGLNNWRSEFNWRDGNNDDRELGLKLYYDTCCWSLRTQFLMQKQDGQESRSIAFKLSLNGLSHTR